MLATDISRELHLLDVSGEACQSSRGISNCSTTHNKNLTAIKICCTSHNTDVLLHKFASFTLCSPSYPCNSFVCVITAAAGRQNSVIEGTCSNSINAESTASRNVVFWEAFGPIFGLCRTSMEVCGDDNRLPSLQRSPVLFTTRHEQKCVSMSSFCLYFIGKVLTWCCGIPSQTQLV